MATSNGDTDSITDYNIKQCLEIIQKKTIALQELGVPCGFCYASQNTLYTIGHPSITKEIETSRDIILTNLSSVRSLATTGNDRMFLPPLPKPLEELSLSDLRTFVINIIKQLGYKWTNDKPLFWPDSVPYQYPPHNIPEGYQGYWRECLRLVLKSLYTTSHLSSSTTLMGGVTEEEVGGAIEEEVGGAIDDEEEEVDVGTPEDVHPVGVVNVESDNEEEDRPPLSYFGYELAQSESSHASSPLHNTHEQEETTSYRGVSLLQPQVIYCPPGLYSQIYPSLSLPTATPTPLLLPLMKQLYVPPTRSESPPTLSPVHSEERHSTPPPPPPLEPVAAKSFVPDTKNRKSKNGMYIYTNPTAPLQFMSLNKSTNHTPTAHSSDTPPTNRHKYDRKLIATAPVSPHTGEPVALRERSHIPHMTTPSNETDSSRKMTSSIKKKRELVFHWYNYKSPETPPTTKRPKLVDTA